MRRPIVSACMLLCLALLGAASAQAKTVWKLQLAQQRQIRHGVASGGLSPCEVWRLQREQACIQGMKRRAWVDGRLSPQERDRIHGRQKRAGHRVFISKHNGLWR